MQWEAVVIPLFLTSLVYAGTLVSKLWLLMNSRIEDCTEDFCCQPTSFMQIVIWAQHFVDRMLAYIHDVLAWRTHVVVSIIIAGSLLSTKFWFILINVKLAHYFTRYSYYLLCNKFPCISHSLFIYMHWIYAMQLLDLLKYFCCTMSSLLKFHYKQ